MATVVSHETHDSTYRVYPINLDGNHYFLAQKFTLPAESEITDLQVYIDSVSGGPINAVELRVYSHSSDSDPWAGSETGVVWSDDAFNATGWVGKTGRTIWSGGTLSPGDYWLRFDLVKLGGPEYIDVGVDSADGYGQITRGYRVGAVWDEIAVDMSFKVLGYSFDPPVPSGLNMMKTSRRLVAAANNRLWVEDV